MTDIHYDSHCRGTVTVTDRKGHTIITHAIDWPLDDNYNAQREAEHEQSEIYRREAAKREPGSYFIFTNWKPAEDEPEPEAFNPVFNKRNWRR
jgi:hypothetical protein